MVGKRQQSCPCLIVEALAHLQCGRNARIRLQGCTLVVDQDEHRILTLRHVVNRALEAKYQVEDLSF